MVGVARQIKNTHTDSVSHGVCWMDAQLCPSNSNCSYETRMIWFFFVSQIKYNEIKDGVARANMQLPHQIT